MQKHILRYLKGTVDYGLKYEVNQKINLECYVDSYWEGSAIDRKSTSGCCFSLGSGVISWFSKKQSYVALSTAEAEYVATCSASCEAVWLRKLLSDYGLKDEAIQNINLEGYVDSDWGRQCHRQEDYFRMLLQYGIRCDLLV